MKDKILDLCKRNNGYVTSAMLREESIPSIYLTRLEEKNMLVHVDRGLYTLPDVIEDPFYIYHLRCPEMIYHKETALYLQDLSNRQFEGFFAVLSHDNAIPRINDLTVQRTRSKNIDVGATVIETPYGNLCRCYDRERCICDLFVYDDFEYEDKAYAIREYAKHHLDAAKLYEYARKLDVYDKVSSIFEVILWDNTCKGEI